MKLSSLAVFLPIVLALLPSVHGGVIARGTLAINSGPIVDDVQYPSDTVFDLLVRNDGDRAISVPTKNLMITSEVCEDLTTVWITVPEARRSDGSHVFPSKASLGIVVLEPGQQMLLIVHASCRVNLGAPVSVRLSIDPGSSERFGIISGEHEITLPKFLPDDLVKGYLPPISD